jgi:hypothetical protein
MPRATPSNGLAWGLIGGGSAALIATVVLNYTYVADAKETYHAACRSIENGQCTVDTGDERIAEDARNSYQSAQLTNRIVTGVGAAVALGGLAMLMYSDSETEPASGIFFFPRREGAEVGWNWIW